MKPLLLPPNPVQHFYLGGDRIAALRGITPETDRQPEEWLGSTVSRFGEGDVGLAVTADGSTLRDLVAADPESWTGSRGAHSASDVGILVKLLDARQRLPVHVHPGREFAASHLACPYGKTEAWFVLETEPGCAVYVGWKEQVDRDELDRRRDAQDSEWMLDHLNRIVVTPGMGILVPAGTAHAIDGGIFVAEVQEPTDFSILLEWSITTSTREESHLDLGFDAVMPAVSTAALDERALSRLVTTVGSAPLQRGPQSVLPSAADGYFRLDRVGGLGGASEPIPAGFAVVLITEGAGELRSSRAEVPVARGEAFVVPQAFDDWVVVGDATALVFRPGAGWPETLRAEGPR